MTNNGGANKNASMRIGGGRSGPVTHDDDTSYISRIMDATPYEQALNADWPGPLVSITAFTAGMRSRSGGVGTTTRHARFVNAAGTGGTSFASTSDSLQTWVTVTPIDVNSASYRPGGGAWSAADFADSVTIFPEAWSDANGSNDARWTSIWGELTYVPPAGGFVFLLQLAGLGALPFVGALADFAQFSRYLSWRRAHHPRHTLLTGDEVRRAWREVREYRHPVWSRAWA